MFAREESRHDFAFLAGVIVGALAGALTTLALTPMSGAETREKLRAQTGNLNVSMGDLKQRAGGLAGAATTRVAPVKDRVTELAAKAPLPLTRHEDILTHENPVRPSAAGAHAQDPAEGRADIGAPRVGSSPAAQAQAAGAHDQLNSEAHVAGKDNGLDATPAQSVTPNIDDEDKPV